MSHIKMKDLLKEFTAAGGMVSQSPWVKEQDDTPTVNIKEKVSSPFSKHLINAQNEIEYMISEHSDAEDEGVYSKPHDAIKLLQIAQKSLGKIK